MNNSIVISKSSAQKLDGIIGSISDFTKNENVRAHIIVNKDDGLLKVILYGDSNYFEFEIEANTNNISEDLVFTCSISKFNSYLKKSLVGNEDVEVSVNNTSIIFVNKKTSSRITLKVYDSVTEEDIEEAKSFLEKSEQTFTDAISAKITKELISFSKFVEKYTGVTGLSNAFFVEGKEAKYADPLCIIRYTLPNDVVSEEGKSVFIHSKIFNMLSSIHKLNGEDYFIKFGDKNNISIEAAGIKGVLQVGNVRWEFPSDDELNEILPSEDDVNIIEISKENLLEALDSFENVFDSNWRMKAIEVTSSDEMIDNKSIKFNHVEYNAEVHSELKIDNVKTKTASDGDKESTFIISSQLIQDVASLIPNEENSLTMEYNNHPVDDGIGPGVRFRTNSVDAFICKMFNT